MNRKVKLDWKQYICLIFLGSTTLLYIFRSKLEQLQLSQKFVSDFASNIESNQLFFVHLISVHEDQKEKKLQ